MSRRTSPTSNGFDFAEAMRRRQRTLQAALSEGRSAHGHPGASGDLGELAWGDTLQRFLPSRYRVSKGTVADATGSTSDAIDLIVHDAQYTPVLFQRESDDDGSIVVPAESVYAVFEAKPAMDKRNLEYAADKVASVRRLQPTSRPITHLTGTEDTKPLHRIIGGIVADRCGWSPCLGSAFESAVGGLTDDRELDLGCALDGGAFEVVRGAVSLGGPKIDRSPTDLTLMFFLVRLFRRLQSIGTAPAIDIAAYASAVLDGDHD